MKTEIPVFTTHSFGNAYFQGEDVNRQAAMRASVAHFEIHRRDDFRFKCKETIASNRLNFYLVFIVTRGEGIHVFGEKEYYLKPGMMCFVSPGLITSWQTTVDDHAGYFCAFTSHSFFNKDWPIVKILSNYPFFQFDGSVVLNLNQDQTIYFNNLFSEIEIEYNADNVYKANLLRALLNVLFQKALKLVDTDHGRCVVDAGNAAQRITKEFIRRYQKDFEPLIDQKMTTVKNLIDYAQQLHVTQNHLNDTIRSVTGKTPGELIRDRITKEAIQLLAHTALSISEVAYLLQFEDPSYFARFFKKHTGLNPKAQRQQFHPV